MKKIFVIALAALSMSFVSCTKKSVEEQAKEYAKQMMEADDMDKAVKVNAEMQKWLEGLSEEDQLKASKAFLEVSNDMGMSKLESAVEEAGDEASAAIQDAAGEVASGIEEAAQKVQGAANEAAQQAQDAAKEAADAAVQQARDAATQAVDDAVKQATDATKKAIDNL